MNKNIFKVLSIASFILMSVTILALELDSMIKKTDGVAMTNSNIKAATAFAIIFALTALVSATIAMAISYRSLEGNMYLSFILIIMLAIVGLAWGSMTIDSMLNPASHMNSVIPDRKFIGYSMALIPLFTLIALPLPIIDTTRSW